MKTLVLSDIHANLPAFEAIMNAAPVCDSVLFLGDIANFGPYPSECVDLLHSINAVCIMGNHDKNIAFQTQNSNIWDQWAAEKLSVSQREWIQSFHNSLITPNYFAIHGIYDVDYDILPNTSDRNIESAFFTLLPEHVNNVLFGHYHYEINRTINGINYHCIRPVGHHRDHDTRASYYILENNNLQHFKVDYDIERLIFDTLNRVNCYDADFLNEWIDLIRNAYSETLLKKDIEQMQKNTIVV